MPAARVASRSETSEAEASTASDQSTSEDDASRPKQALREGGSGDVHAGGPEVRIQPKLNVNEPGDRYEREAERVADVVTRTPDEGTENTKENFPENRIQRMCPRCRRRAKEGKPLDCEECERELRSRGEGSGVSRDDIQRAAAIANRSGRPLPKSTRLFFERRMGRGFGDVRVHTGAEANRAAQSIDARAFTIGSDIAFAENRYDPMSSQGQRLLAHELTHIVQQKDGARNTDIRRQENESKKSSEGSSTTGKGGEKAKKEKEKGIDERVDAFVEDMNRRLKAIRKVYKKGKQRSQSVAAGAERVGGESLEESSGTETGEGNSANAKAGSVPTLRVKKKAASRSLRTPTEQAQGVVEGTSWTCRSAHLEGNARHVWLLIAGSIAWNPVRDLKKKFNEAVYNKFVAAWSSMMTKQGLKNYKGEDGWAPRDAYHLELPGGRVSGDAVIKCVREYVRLTREEGQSRNKEFERYYATEIQKVEREAFKKAGGAVAKAVREARTSSPKTD